MVFKGKGISFKESVFGVVEMSSIRIMFAKNANYTNLEVDLWMLIGFVMVTSRRFILEQS